MKKILAIILTLLLAVQAVPLSVMAAGTVAEDHCTFTLQENTSDRPYPESLHSYLNNTYSGWTYSVPGADCLKLEFSPNTSFESGFDYLWLYSVKDGIRRLENKYTGASLEGATVIVPGDTVSLILDTDEDERDWGFRLDAIYSGVCNGHDYDEGVVTKAPTCADAGTKTVTCQYCSNYYCEEIAPLTANRTHTMDAGTVTRNPTCVTTGIRTHICSVCQVAVEETIPALSENLTHSYDYLSPEYSGSSRTFTCTVCGAKRSTSKFGSCGPALNYYIFESGFYYTLVIAGYGQMTNYSLNSSSYSTQSTAPWGSSIDEVIFAGDITSIGSYAFYKSEITSADLPDTIESIGMAAFSNSKLTSVSLPASLKTIGDSAFARAPLDIDRMPAGVRTIGNNAFVGTKLTSLAFADRPAGETLTIGMDAFNSVETLTELDLGKGPLEIGSYAFAYCKAISSPLRILEDYSVGSSAFLHCESIETAYLEIPELPSNLLECCYGLREVELVNTVKVNVGAFSGTTSLTSVVFPETTEILDGTVFNMQIASGKAPALQRVTFLNRNTSIDSYAFQFASQLSDVYGIDCSTAAAYARNHSLTFHEIGSAEHTFDPDDEGTVAKEPSCTEEGVLEKICTFCGAAISLPIPAFGHDWDKPIYGWSEDNGTVTATHVCKRDPSHSETEIVSTQAEVTKAATCEERGATTWTAVFENEAFSPQTREAENIEALGHTPGGHVKENEIMPGCTTEGSYEETVYCAVCGKELSRAVKTSPATGHDWGEWVVLKEATEESEGLEARACKNDPGHMEQRVIPILEHVHVLMKTEAAAATCKEAGNIEYWTCSGCGKYFLDEAGEQEIQKEETILAVLEHDWDEGVVITEASCTAPGEKTYTCRRCMDTYTEVLAATGHDWDEGSVTKEATCTEAGEKTYICGNDSAHTKTEEIPALGHELKHVEASAATCTAAGNIEYWMCERCEKVFRDEEGTAEMPLGDTVTPATGHDWDEGAVTKEAACTEAGEKTYACRNDSAHTKTEEIPILPHSFGSDGYCTHCGEFIFTDVTGKKSKEYVSWAYENGIVKGTGENSFSPDDGCTRIQFIMMLWKMNGKKTVGGTNPFKDISGSSTTKAVLWALNAGVINRGEYFKPDDYISRIQIAMILWKLAGSPAEGGSFPFADVPGTKAKKAVQWLYNNRITTGTSDTTFSPDDNCTRLQLVIFLYKYNNM